MRYFITAIILIINLILQSTLFEYIAIIGIKPNTAIIIIVSIAFMRGEIEGAFVGLTTGILQDSFFSSFIGIHAFLGMATGFLCGKLYRGFYKENFIIPISLTIISTLLYEIFYYILSILLRGYTNFLYFLNKIILPEVVYTAIFSILVYQILYFINKKLEVKENLKRKLF